LNYLRGLHNILGFTNDGGNTFKNALTPQGLNAEVVVGKLGVFATVKTDQILIGNNLIGDGLIQSASTWNNAVQQGTLYNGVSINAANGFVVNRSDNKVRGIFNATQGLKFQKFETNTWVDKFYADSSGNLIANSLSITGGSINIGANFSVSSSGILSATSANISGNVTANSLVAGVSISSPNIYSGSIVGTTINIGNGNFTVNSNGDVFANNGSFKGIINATSGNFSGNITSTATITGGTIAGAIIKTATSGRRIEIGNGGLKGYGNNGALNGLVYVPTETDITDIGIYHLGSRLLEFYDNIDGITIRPASGSNYMHLGVSGKATYAIGVWNFDSAIVENLNVTAKFA
jgi:hypothetical protein